MRPAIVLLPAAIAPLISGTAARAATVTVSPAAPTRGATVLVTGTGLSPRATGTATIRGGARVAFRTDRRGAFRATVPVSGHARLGRRSLLVRTRRIRVRAPIRIVRLAGVPSVVGVSSRGPRILLTPDRGPRGARLRLDGSRYPRRARVAATLARVTLARARAHRTGRFAARLRLPAIATGRHVLSVRGGRTRIALPIIVERAPAVQPPAPQPSPSPTPQPSPTPGPGPQPPVIAAAGDIACDPMDPSFNGGAGTATNCRQRDVSDAILSSGAAAVLPLGDVQYTQASPSQFAASYQPSWGRLDALAHPVTGNHEYLTPGASGYFGYFGARAGQPSQGYYSFDVGTWHLIALNSNCEIVACAAGSAQEQWLKADLAAHRNMCTLAYWHHPHFTSGNGAGDEDTTAFWNDLYAAGADLVLVGHSHDYERFAPLTPAGKPDAANGIREFVVGTGGDDHTSFPHPILPGTEVRDDTTFGFLALTLRPTGYDWRFMPVGGAFSDAGAGSCH